MVVMILFVLVGCLMTWWVVFSDRFDVLKSCFGCSVGLLVMFFMSCACC